MSEAGEELEAACDAALDDMTGSLDEYTEIALAKKIVARLRGPKASAY